MVQYDVKETITATVNTRSYQIDKCEFMCMRCGAKFLSKQDLCRHTMVNHEGKLILNVCVKRHVIGCPEGVNKLLNFNNVNIYQ